jgi:hypothetical protein
MTFGPKYSVSESKRHFRSLFRTLPSVLMEAILSCIHTSTVYQTPSIVSDDEEMGNAIDFGSIAALNAEENIINQKVLARMLQRIGLKNIDIVDKGKKAVEQSLDQRIDQFGFIETLSFHSGLVGDMVSINSFHSQYPAGSIIGINLGDKYICHVGI